MKIYHNPRCSKSRETLNIILKNDIKPDIHLYLENPLSIEEIKYILKLLDTSPENIVRKNEDIYKTLDLKNANKDMLIQMIHENPILLERPIVISKNQAILGRPPENVKQLITNNP
jgi:arsenate reductase (glutaredoxin)